MSCLGGIMAKIPVGEPIARSYGFAFGNILNNLGAIWIPDAILYALIFVFKKPYMDAAAAMASRDPSALRAAIPILIAAGIIMFVLIAAQVVSITREALGLRIGNAFLQFPFGAPLWRLLLAYLSLLGVMIIFYVAALVAGVVIAIIGATVFAAAGSAGKLIGGAVLAVGVIAAFCAFIYAFVRLSFLMMPIAVAEGRRTLRRGWALMRGNFWRSVSVILSILIPLAILEFGYFYWLMGTDWLVPPHLGTMSPQDAAVWSQQQQAAVRHSMERTQQLWFIVYPIGLVFGLLIYGLFAGASAFAYRSLTSESTSSGT